MSKADIIILIVVLLGAWGGYKQGFLMELISLGAIVLGIFCGFKLMGEMMLFLEFEKVSMHQWTLDEIETLDRKVIRYRRLFKEGGVDARDALLAIDAHLLQGYRLAPRLERRLLNGFRGAQRPVPFEFIEYFPNESPSCIPL